MHLCLLFYRSMVKPPLSLGPAALPSVYLSSLTRTTGSWSESDQPLEHTSKGQLLPGCFSKHLENVARLPLLLWGSWGIFKIPWCSYFGLKEGYRGIPNRFRSYFPTLLYVLQICGSELIPETGMCRHFLFSNIVSPRTT